MKFGTDSFSLSVIFVKIGILAVILYYTVLINFYPQFHFFSYFDEIWNS